jgi:hypothetical protein
MGSIECSTFGEDMMDRNDVEVFHKRASVRWSAVDYVVPIGGMKRGKLWPGNYCVSGNDLYTLRSCQQIVKNSY